MLRDIIIKTVYNSISDDVMKDFYIPVLSKAKFYYRISAYFDSNILSLYSKGIENIISNNGKIKFIFSCDISPSDYDLIKKGYDIKSQLESKVLDEILNIDFSKSASDLVFLIASGIVDVKIAYTMSGIFHDKYGLISDETDTVYFRGSNNETVAAIQSNYESFETSFTWDCDKYEYFKIRNARENFEKIWNNQVEGLYVSEPSNELLNCLIEKSVKLTNVNKRFIFLSIDENNHVILSSNSSLLNEHSMFYKFYLYPYVLSYNVNSITLNQMNYNDLQNFIEDLKCLEDDNDFQLIISAKVQKFLSEMDYMISKRMKLGIAIKSKDDYLVDDFMQFCQIIKQVMKRELRESQLWDAYHMARMIKSANFSVPGAGKTSVVYGAFAYLSYINKVDKIVMIGPKNSFVSWRDEFELCFGDKKELRILDVHSDEYKHNRKQSIKYHSENKNLILVNYESVPTLRENLSRIIDSKTMLVFDEIHRIKSISGIRAVNCLDISKNAVYKIALTGTPIPNGYLDIYNLFNILYTDEYNTYFSFTPSQLKKASYDSDLAAQINKKIYPFFCRTTKKELEVPDPEEDDLISGYIEMNQEEEKLMRIVYENFSENSLVLYIRLQQASSNPQLLTCSLKKDELYFIDEDFDDQEIIDIDKYSKSSLSEENKNFIENIKTSRKMQRCIEIIEKRVANGENVLAWGIFVDSMNLLSSKLRELGIPNEVISGSTSQTDREEIIKKFQNNQLKVLITNPHTLAESVSLHKECHFAIYFEYDFNLTHMVQSRDRIHRLGLPSDAKTEYVYMILNSKSSIYNSIDEKIYRRLKWKESVMLNAVENQGLVFVEDDFYEDIKQIIYE